MSSERHSLNITSVVSSGGLWIWGLSLLVAGTLLTIYGADISHSISGISDRLSQELAEFLVTFARLSLAPAGAMLTTLAIVVRVSKAE